MLKKPAKLFLIPFVSIVFLSGCILSVMVYDSLSSRSREVNDQWLSIEYVTAYRHELVVSVMERVGRYAPHERETLTAATKALVNAAEIRNNKQLAREDFGSYAQKFQEAQNEISNSWQQLVATAEKHPGLRNDPFFRILLPQFSATEDWIDHSQQIYNEKVQIYNTTKERYSLFANLLGFEDKPYFEAMEKARSW